MEVFRMDKSECNADMGLVYDFFDQNYKKYGYSPKSLGWNKGKQNIRFEQLTKFFGLENRAGERISIFDIGCGFGDLNKYLSRKNFINYKYTGCDIVGGFIETANKEYKDNEDIDFLYGDFLNLEILEKYDLVIASGIFNLKMPEKGNYQNISDVMGKALDICKEDGGIAFDFQSDKVDFCGGDVAFHNSPEKVLEIAYKFSRNIILDNSYMPFEFALTVFKNDSFQKETTTFCKFIRENRNKYDEGLF